MANDLIVRLLLKTQSFDTDIKKSARQIDSFKRSCDSASKNITTMANSLGINIGALTKMGTAIGIATTALKVAKDAFFTLEGNIDEFGRTCEGAKGAYDVMLKTLVNGNWSNFFTNVDEAIKRARKLYDEIDRLGSIRNNDKAAIAIAENEVKTYRNLVKTEKDPTKKAKYEKALEAANKKLADLKQEEVTQARKTSKQQWDKTIKSYTDTSTGVRPNQKSINWAYSQLMTRGQSFVDEQTQKRAELEAKGQTKKYVYMPGNQGAVLKDVFDITKLSAAEQATYNLAKAVVEGETQYKDAINYRADAERKYGEQLDEKLRVDKLLGNTSGGGGGTSTKGTSTKQDEIAQQGSIKWFEDEISKLKKTIATTTDETVRANALKTAQEYEKAIEAINQKMVNGGKVSLEMITPMLNRQQTPKRSLDEEIAYNSQVEKQRQADKWNNQKTRPMSELLSPELSISSDFDPFKKGEDEANKKAMQIQSTWQSISSTISSVGGALASLGGEGMEVVGIIAQAIAELTMSFAMAMAKEGSQGNVWTWIAAGAAGLATLITMIATLKSANKFEEGGIIGGNSFTGDKLFVRANSGEMIINRKQQSNLFSMINNGGGGNMSNGGGDVRFHIEGRQLVGVLNNFNNKRGKTL